MVKKIFVKKFNSFSEAEKWEKAACLFLFVFAASDLFSISVAQVAAAGLGICWGGIWKESKKRPNFSPLLWPFAAFILASLVAAASSLNPIESFRDCKDLLHIIIFLAAYDLFQRDTKRIDSAFRIIVGAGTFIALVGLGQAFMRGVSLSNRISGFNDIYMTYAGLLMLAVVLGLAVLLFSFQKWSDTWIPLGIGLMLFAILISLTRNAYIGVLAGSVTLLALRKPLTLFIVPLIVVFVFFISPPEILDRLKSVVDISNATNQDRLLMWKAGLDIISDYPFFGIGQNSFPTVYPGYIYPGASASVPHLHNNFIEIAAERGMVGLLSWLSIWITALWVMGSALKKGVAQVWENGTALAAGTGSTLAFLSAGMFEYNFGDSEIQMLIYLILAAGMASAKRNQA